MNFYETKAWKKKRQVILKRDGYMCQQALREGRRVPATTVHHIFPLDRYPQYRMANWNLISLSAKGHELMHNRFDGSLSKLGKRWKMEAALKNNIPLNTTILVVGLPGSGKSTEAKRVLGSGICYDADAIAAAFRLTSVHGEDHAGAKDFAQDFFKPFLAKVEDYTDRVVIIRTAPTIDELQLIDPDEIIICKGKHDISRRRDLASLRDVDWNEKQKRIDEVEAWAKASQVKYLIIE